MGATGAAAGGRQAGAAEKKVAAKRAGGKWRAEPRGKIWGGKKPPGFAIVGLETFPAPAALQRSPGHARQHYIFRRGTGGVPPSAEERDVT